MDVFWWIVTGLFIAALIGMWVVLGVRGSLISRAEHASPEDAKALREIQAQIDSSTAYDSRFRIFGSLFKR